MTELDTLSTQIKQKLLIDHWAVVSCCQAQVAPLIQYLISLFFSVYWNKVVLPTKLWRKRQRETILDVLHLL